MLRFISQIQFIRIFALSFLIFNQGCELLQKRDTTENTDNNKNSRKFKLLAYVFNEQLAVSDNSDPQRYIRNNLSTITAATLVANAESTFSPWHRPAARCLPINTTDLLVQRIRMNLDMGEFTLMSESTLQKAPINMQNTNVGPVYSAFGYLPPAGYSFSATGASSVLAWNETAVPSLNTGSEIQIWSNSAWAQSVSPDLDLTEHYTIRASEDFKIKYKAPADADYTLVQLTDSLGNRIACYGESGDSEVLIPQASLAELEPGAGASIEIKFTYSRLNTSHPRLDEVFVQSTSRHVFGRIRQSADQYLDFGVVEIAP